MKVPYSVQSRAARWAWRLGLTDPFASCWDAASRRRIEDLVGRIARCAAREGIGLFLFWGTLLGHVRQGDILPWDDDVDLALFEVPPAAVAALLAACRAEGLAAMEIDPGEKIIKIFDPGFTPIPGHAWTWPFVDLFVYRTTPLIGADPGVWDDRPPVPPEMVLPGTPVAFAGADLLLPRQADDILDRFYPGWHREERSSSWNHRLEAEIRFPQSRRIRTHAQGRKIVPERR